MVKALLIPLALAYLISTATAISKNDINLSNSGLNLECLLAEFYSYAAYGKGLSAALRGGGPPPIGGKKALLSPEALELAVEFAKVEIGHVTAIRFYLGNLSIACPQINIGSAFANLVDAAVGSKLSPAFDPYGSDLLFYHAAFFLEEVVVLAYHGSITLFEDKSGLLYNAGGFIGVESYHAGFIREKLRSVRDEYVFPYSTKVYDLIEKISKYRKTLSKNEDVGLGKYVPTDAFGNLYGFNFTSLRSVVYQGSKPGGFYPKGFNGFYK